MKKFKKWIYLIFTLALLIFQCSYANAEIKIIEKTATYRMGGDGIEESLPIAKERALEKTMRLAAEEAGIYLETHSESIQGKLTKDKITVIAATIMELIGDPEYDSKMIDSKNLTIDIICKIKVKVDTSKISLENIQETEKLLKNVEDKDRRIKDLEEEVKRLKSQSSSATSETQKQQIQEAFNENQRKFLIAKYERDIDIYDFSSSINTQSMLETANKLTEIDPLNTSAFLATVYCYRVQDQMQKTIDYCKDIIRLNSSPKLMIEAYTQLGDIYYNELNNKTEAKKYLDQGIALVKKQYSKAQIEDLVNGTNFEVRNMGGNLIGKSNSIKELYILKSEIEGCNPTFKAITTIDTAFEKVLEDRFYNMKYRTDW